MPSLLARLIAQIEGYNTPGSIPNRRNNPGDLRHSPHSTHPTDPNAIGTIDTPEHGWEDLERQLQLYAYRGFTLQQLVEVYAPATENDTSNYLKFLCAGLHCGSQDSIASILANDNDRTNTAGGSNA